MLHAMLAACATLIFVLAVLRAVEARRLARLFRAKQKWAEMMDPGRSPNCKGPWCTTPVGKTEFNCCTQKTVLVSGACAI